MFAGLHAAQAQTATAAPIPAETFFRHADIDRAALSPSGRWLAMSTGLGGARVGLVVFDLQAWGQLNHAVRFTDADVYKFEWVNDERLVANIIDLASGSGDQRMPVPGGLFSVRRDGTELRMLVRPRRDFYTDLQITGREPLEWNHILLHVPDEGGHEVIVGEGRFDNLNEFQSIIPKRLNVVTRHVTSLAVGAPPHAREWLFDTKGEPRLTVTISEGRAGVHWRAPGQTKWQQLAEFDYLKPPFTPQFVDDTGNLYVTTTEGQESTTALKKFDFARGQPQNDFVVRTPGFDFDGSLVSETVGGRALGVRATTDAEATVWFDKRLAELQKEADKRLPGRVNQLTCRRCDKPDMVVLVKSWSDRDPGQYWIYRADEARWRMVGRLRKDVEPRRMAATEFARIRARDGLDLPVWVTFPNGPKTVPRPAVVLVHGGPWVRGTRWQWNPYSQFLASRGYVVIEPEFRGGEGFGDEHFRAGWRQWGRAMQDDVADALQWAVKQGWVDSKRVCIAGASYGGYATLMGLVRHADLYRCGVAWVAVTDPRLMFKWHWGNDISEEARKYGYPALIGDPTQNADGWDAITPVAQAANIKAPLLLAFGGKDWRVPLEHGTRMREALRAAGRDPEWVLYDDEGHGWLKVENRVDFARRIERFLAQHLQ
jgi:acetyl esterase/lipase